MKWPARFRPRERRLALLAGVLTGCWVLVSWIMQPLWDRMREVQQHRESQTGKLEMFSGLLEQGPAIERTREQFAPYLSVQEGEAGPGAFLNELEALCRTTHLQLNLKPKPIKQDGRASRLEVELDVEGSQTNILAFLDALLRVQKLVSLERVRLASVPTKENVLRANLVIQQLVLHSIK